MADTSIENDGQGMIVNPKPTADNQDWDGDDADRADRLRFEEEQAMIDDGMLDVVVMSPRSAIGWLAMYWKIVLKHKRTLPVMTYYRSGKITIRCAEPMPTQVDGDPSGEATKVTVQIAPGSLLVRVKDGTEAD